MPQKQVSGAGFILTTEPFSKVAAMLQTPSLNQLWCFPAAGIWIFSRLSNGRGLLVFQETCFHLLRTTATTFALANEVRSFTGLTTAPSTNAGPAWLRGTIKYASSASNDQDA